MRWAAITAATLAALLAAGAVAACGETYSTCYPGDYRACTCEGDGGAGATSGYQACLPSQDGYAACVCDGRTPGVDAAARPSSTR